MLCGTICIMRINLHRSCWMWSGTASARNIILFVPSRLTSSGFDATYAFITSGIPGPRTQDMIVIVITYKDLYIAS